MGLLTRIQGELNAGGFLSSGAAKEGDALRLELLDSFENTGLGCFWATDEKGHLTYLSPVAIESFGVQHDDLLGRPLTDVLVADGSDDPDTHERPLGFLLSARSTITALTTRVKIADTVIWWEIAGRPHFGPGGKFLGYRGSAKDVTQQRERQEASEKLAMSDSLTGLANRHHMERLLEKTLYSARNSKRACALMMMDLDRFKAVNDTLGHQAGDELLKQVSARLGTVVARRGTIGRLGGDEFLIMLPDMDDRGELGEIAQSIIQLVSQPYSVDGTRAIIGASVGIATAPYDGLEAEALTSAADMALYAAKGGGRGQFRFFASDLKDGAQMRHRIEEDLRDALAREELELHYQPIVSSATHHMTCLEALLRWHHPERGYVPPSIFVPVAEEMGLIRDVGAFVLRRACRDAASWAEPLRVAVNVSAAQFARDDFPAQVASALKEFGLDPARLELEITESVFVGDADHTQRLFEELKALGIRLALDDFGTGYSSLSYLQRAPFDKIKIDRSFVRGATDETNNNPQILSAIVSLAEALQMETVAEGVETHDELKLVTDRGASHVQGFIFSQAMTQSALMLRLDHGQTLMEAKGPSRFRAERKTLFRRIGVIHGDHRYRGVLKNLSKTGAMVEGLKGVPVGTQLVLDLGSGQLAVCTVRRSDDATLGVEFENSLVSDGAEGLCTRHRVSPYEIEAAGRPLSALPLDAYSLLMEPATSPPLFTEVKTRDTRVLDPNTGYEYRYR